MSNGLVGIMSNCAVLAKNGAVDLMRTHPGWTIAVLGLPVTYVLLFGWNGVVTVAWIPVVMLAVVMLVRPMMTVGGFDGPGEAELRETGLSGIPAAGNSMPPEVRTALIKLGLNPEGQIGAKNVSSAFRLKAKTMHPDVNRGSIASDAAFKELGNARAVASSHFR